MFTLKVCANTTRWIPDVADITEIGHLYGEMAFPGQSKGFDLKVELPFLLREFCEERGLDYLANAVVAYPEGTGVYGLHFKIISYAISSQPETSFDYHYMVVPKGSCFIMENGKTIDRI